VALPRVEERLRVQRLVLHDPKNECVGAAERLPRASVRQSMRGAVHPEGGRSSLTESRRCLRDRASGGGRGGSLARQMGREWDGLNGTSAFRISSGNTCGSSRRSRSRYSARSCTPTGSEAQCPLHAHSDCPPLRSLRPISD
jgi:hypothetical protein